MLSRGSEPRYNFSELDRRSTIKAIITSDWKYIYNFKNETGQLYNIKSDNKELIDLAHKKQEQCDQLKEQLLTWISTSKTYRVNN